MSSSRSIQPVSRPVDTVIAIPGSKSITNRALLMAGLARGESVIEGALFSEDTHYMSEALNQLGAQVVGDETHNRFTVSGTGGVFPVSKAELFIGNAGTAARFLTAALSLGNGTYRLDGVARMRERPIADLIEALGSLGVDVIAELNNGCPPLIVRANGLEGGEVRVRGDVSSQFLSALLLVAPYSVRGLFVEVDGDLVSFPYVQMTLQMMWQWGAMAEQITEDHYHVPGHQRYIGQTYRVEPDASGASYFFAAAAVTGGRVTVPGLTRNALQGDVGFVDVLARMGCRVQYDPDGITVTGPTQLRGVDVDMRDISDTVMTLAAIAPFAHGATHIRNVANIRVKETDRIHAVATELTRLGVQVEAHPDGLTIHPAQEFRPAEIETYDDHRIAMSFAVTGLKAPGITLLNPDCVRKTFPDFFERFQRLYY